VPELTDIAALNLSISLAYPISCVVGAPGAGKTSQLVKAVAQLESEFHPDRILVLTPSRLAAVTLRDQIALSSGKPSNSFRRETLTSSCFPDQHSSNSYRNWWPARKTKLHGA
jgi:superfamily I DNA/RNA helicase